MISMQDYGNTFHGKKWEKSFGNVWGNEALLVWRYVISWATIPHNKGTHVTVHSDEEHCQIQEFIYQAYPSPSIQGRAPVDPIPPAWSPLPTDSSCGVISDLLPSRSSPWGCWATCRTACITLITRIITLMWFTYGSQHKSPTVLCSLGHYFLIINIVQIIRHWCLIQHKCFFQGQVEQGQRGSQLPNMLL